MTDKEWKELCEWAISLNKKDVYITKRNAIEWISVGNCFEETLGFFKDGMVIGESIISRNRTAKQIKSIIENLIEEV